MYKLKRGAIAGPAVVEGEIGQLVRRDVVEPRVHEVKDDNKVVAENINTLLQRVSASAVQEIDLLISELQMSRERLRLEGERVQREMIEYATLSHSVMQSTKIIRENLDNWKTPEASRSAEKASCG